jgi:hypothetical protein
MRTVIAVLVGLLISGTAAAQSPIRLFELSTTGGLSDGPGYAGKAPVASVDASFGMSWLRVNGGMSYSRLHKQGTSGGYQSSTSYSVEAGFRNAFVLAGMNGNHTDQTEYTKDVDYRFVGAGYRWAGSWRKDRAVSINQLSVSYYRESRSTYANHTEMYAVRYGWDRQLTGALYLRVSLRLGAMYFDDNPYPGAQRRSGLASNVSIGLVGRP